MKKFDILNSPPVQQEFDQQLEKIDTQFQILMLIVVISGISLFVAIIWFQDSMPIPGVALLLLTLRFGYLANERDQYLPANAARHAIIEQYLEVPEIKQYLSVVNIQSRKLTYGEVDLIREFGYQSKCNDQDAQILSKFYKPGN